MKVLILSEYGEALGLARKILDEGHTVFTFIKNRAGLSGDEIVPIADTWRPFVTNADLVICDSSAFHYYTETLKIKGKTLFNFHPSFVPDGSVGWFNGRDWIKPFIKVKSYQRMLTGDLGPVTVSMGTVAQSAETAPALENMTLELRRGGFIGPVGGFTNNIMDILLEGLKESVSDVIFETATGTKKELVFTNDHIVCVRVMGEGKGHPIDGLSEENLRHIRLYNVSKDKAGNYFSWGGTVLKACARGRDLKEARSRVYRTLKNIHFDDMQYRLDIGEK